MTTRCLPAASTVTTYQLAPPTIPPPQPPTPTNDDEATAVTFELGAGSGPPTNITTNPFFSTSSNSNRHNHNHPLSHQEQAETATRRIDNSHYNNSSTNDSGIDIQAPSAETAGTVDRPATEYVRNKSTTRSWPVIHRNNSYRYQLQPSGHNHRRQQSHQYYQYDYDALTGVNCPANDTNNNINFTPNEDYLAYNSSYDKSPSIDSYYYQHYRPSMQQSTTTMTTTTAGQGGATITSTAHQTQPGTATCCMMPPPVLFLFFTLLMTSSATAMLCAAIMTDHWEHVSWNRDHLERLANKSSIELQWYLDGRAAKFSVSEMHRKSGDARSKDLDLPRRYGYGPRNNKPSPVDSRANVFLVPMNGGIWTLCVDLTPDELRSMSGDGFPQVDQCVNYLAGNTDGAQPNANEENTRAEWQHSEFQPSLHPHLSRYNCV